MVNDLGRLGDLGMRIVGRIADEHQALDVTHDEEEEEDDPQRVRGPFL